MGRKSRIKEEKRNEVRNIVPQAKPPAAPSTPFHKIALTFAALVAVLEVIVKLGIDWSPLQLATAALTTFLLQATGLPVIANGIHRTLPNARWEIVADCTAIGAQTIFLAFVLVFPASKKAKALAAGAGIPFLFAINIIRLVVLAWITAFSPVIAGYFHDFVWQMGFLFLVVGMWLAWIEWVVKREKNSAFSG